jgi:hypothetical protein
MLRLGLGLGLDRDGSGRVLPYDSSLILQGE